MSNLNVFLFEGVGGVGKSSSIDMVAKTMNVKNARAKAWRTHFPIKPFNPSFIHFSEPQKSVCYFNEQLNTLSSEVERLTAGEDAGVHPETVLLFDRGFLSSAVYHFDSVECIRVASGYTELMYKHIEHLANFYGVGIAFHIIYFDATLEDIMKSKMARIRQGNPEISPSELFRILQESQSKTEQLLERYSNVTTGVENLLRGRKSVVTGWDLTCMTFNRIEKKMFNYGEHQLDFSDTDHAGVPRIFKTKEDLIQHHNWNLARLVHRLNEENQ
jgi:thymidylate kinase